MNTEEWGVPYYNTNAEGRLTRRLNGQTQAGALVNGEFVPDPEPEPPVNE